MARWSHLFPSRTQKLSTAVAIVVEESARVARCRAFSFMGVFCPFLLSFNLLGELIFDQENPLILK